ncbi:MAG: radical SAM protein, partial [Candidatus Cloacimonetes bacterium]|nr:radical SAM protein [Candidatus Cloacimonadota bacterium]
MIKKKYTFPKKIIRKNLHPDSFLLIKYGFSPYRACQHACKYCDGRAEKYFITGDFEKDIEIRKNLPEILTKEIGKLRERGFIVAGSGVSDPYQQSEITEKIMRSAAQIILDNGLPMIVLTKSALVLRDIDLYKQINTNSRMILMVSLTFSNDEERKIFEPYASPVEERLRVLSEFSKQGIPVGVLMMPLLQGISDTDTNVNELLFKIAEIGVDFIVPGSLTLRPGIQKNTFSSVIERHYPQLIDEYRLLYAENRASGNSILSYRNSFYNQIISKIRQHNSP